MKKNNLMILIASPKRSGVKCSALQMEKNLKKLEDAALPIFRAGHIPVIGEWLALPLLKAAGSESTKDPIYDDILYPIAARIMRKCDAVLLVEDVSKKTDEDVLLAKILGIPVYYSLEDIIA